MSDHHKPPHDVNPFSHPGPPPPYPDVNPFSHPGPPPPYPGVNPFSHPGTLPRPGVNPFSHPGHQPRHPDHLPKDVSAVNGSSSSSDSPLTEYRHLSAAGDGNASASIPIEVKLRHTREIVFEKPVKNTSFSSKTAIVDIVPFSGTPKTITLVGNAPGDAHVTFLFTDGTADRVPVSVTD
jgi:hypothetical protein